MTNLDDLRPHLAVLEEDFDYYMGYHSYLNSQMIPWPADYRKVLTERLQFELQETPIHYQHLTSVIQSACQSSISSLSMDINSMKAATKLLDNLDFPHHNTPNPPNPITAHPNDDRQWNSVGWKEVKLPKQRNTSKTLKVALERCLRRCLYFIFQNSLQKFWPPPSNALCYERTNINQYVRITFLCGI